MKRINYLQIICNYFLYSINGKTSKDTQSRFEQIFISTRLLGRKTVIRKKTLILPKINIYICNLFHALPGEKWLHLTCCQVTFNALWREKSISIPYSRKRNFLWSLTLANWNKENWSALFCSRTCKSLLLVSSSTFPTSSDRWGRNSIPLMWFQKKITDGI